MSLTDDLHPAIQSGVTKLKTLNRNLLRNHGTPTKRYEPAGLDVKSIVAPAVGAAARRSSHHTRAAHAIAQTVNGLRRLNFWNSAPRKSNFRSKRAASFSSAVAKKIWRSPLIAISRR